MMDSVQFDSDALQIIQNWGKKIRYYVGIDVGGTNTRVAIARDNDTNIVQVCKFQAKTVPLLINGLSSVGKKLVEIFDSSPHASCLAVAGPVSDFGEKAVVTNYLGSEAERTLLKSQISDTIFPKSSSRFINDLEGTCNGINALNSQNKLSEFFELLWPNDMISQTSERVNLAPVHYVVLAMGTGLGTALLQQDPFCRSSRHSVLPLEAGHALVNELGPSHRDYLMERDLIHHLSQKLYNGRTTIEYEDICSGRGLGYVYEYLTKESLSAAEIVKRASGNPPDNNAIKALQIHYRYLLRIAQSLCVSTQAKGVLLAGDNQVSNLNFVRSFASILKEEFLNHVKVSWLQPVAVFTQTKVFNFNLAGALHFAKSLVLTK